MKTVFRSLAALISLALLLLALFGAYQVLRYHSRQVQVPPARLAEVPAQAAQRLAEAIRVPSISASAGVDSLAFLRLDSLLRRHFPLADSLLGIQGMGHCAWFIEWPGSNAALDPVLCVAHTDVVPVEAASASAWSQPPFGGQIADGYIWGRGSLDDKVNAWAMMEALEALLAEGFRPTRSLFFAFGNDEETGGHHGARQLARHFAQRGLRFAYVIDEGLPVLEGAMPGLARPAAMIGVAEKGYLSLTLRVDLAEGGHSSMPPAETAIGILATGLARLQARPFPAKIDGAVAQFLDHVGPELEGPAHVLLANRWLLGGLIKRQLAADAATAALLRTTAAATLLRAGEKDNVLPSVAEAVVNFRILPGESCASTQARVGQVLADPRIQVLARDSASQSEPSPISPLSGFGYRVIERSIREVFPQAVVAPNLMIALTDSRHYAPLAEGVYRFSPLRLQRSDLERIHGVDERIGVADYGKAIQFYQRLLQHSAQ